MAHGRKRKAVRWIDGHAHVVKHGEAAAKTVCGSAVPLAEHCRVCERTLEMNW